MSYKFSKGSQVIGDLKAADDTQRDTLIDFGEDRIDLQTSGSTRLKISGSQGQVTFNEQYTFPYLDGNRDQVLATDGNGAVSWVDPATGGGGGSDVPENVVTGSTGFSLDDADDRSTIIITPLSGDTTYTLPTPTANYKVKFLAGVNLDNYNLIFKTKLSSQKIFGMFYRISFGGDGDTGYDLTPQSYAGAAASKFVGGASEDHKNTITIDNALQGSEIDFYSDGVYWYVKGEIVAAASTTAVAATITFSSGSY